ncbi:unnamed protein product [Kluyveromyces dobzhanskii CBS 2104]|uniref:WGS project CCBQ000000000 data, contig 00106 n=1 Tax=Kluyveromyces dobzhanskii CBS 2104 TaxID=1427455 RepID=A0A0A8L5Z9_9SACH|nr:unnamed protein product [Kluyveromyces dobzhanskii CBS 2104]
MPSVEESVATIRAELKYLKEQNALAESAVKDIESLLPRARPQPPINDSMSQKKEFVEALYAFQPQQEGDLALNAGDRIEVLEKLSPEWYKGTCNGNVGVFPSNYVKPVEKKDIEARASVGTPSQAAVVPTPPQYAAYTPPPQQQQASSPFPPQFTGYYGQPGQHQMQQQVPQQVPQQQQQPQQSGHAGSAAFKKFGGKLGNAAIFGAGATIGSDIVNSIF